MGRLEWSLTVATMFVSAAVTTEAYAQQSLEIFTEAALSYEPGLRAARHEEAAAEGRVREARGALLPDLTASAGYRRNQTESVVQRMNADGSSTTANILPYNQFDLSIELGVPILDLGAWSSLDAAEASAEGSVHEKRAVELDVRMRVVAEWYRLVGARAVIDAAEERLRVAERALVDVEARHAEGLSPQLDVSRAQAEVGLARESVAAARLEERLAERALVALTGVVPDDSRAVLDVDDRAPRGLADYRARIDALPTVTAARARARSLEGAESAARRRLVPVVRGFARERYTNASGFQPESLWSLGVVAEWRLDFSRIAAFTTSTETLSAADARYEAARVAAETAIVEAWNRVEAGRARVEASRATLDASERALADSNERYEAGRGTQLDQLLAQRDRFAARVALTLATAQLASARAILSALTGL